MTFKDFLKGAGMTAAAVALGILAGRELGHLGENLIKKGERIKNPQQLERKVQEPDISGVVRVPKGTSMDFYPDGTHSQPKPINENKLEGSLLAYAEYTGNFEGRRNKIYDPNPDDDKSEPTIGVGHYLDRGDSKEVFTRVLPEVDYNAIYAGKQELTTEQINRLFAYDIKKYVEKTKKLFPKFDSYPKYLRQALVDGCLGGNYLEAQKQGD